MNTQLRYNYTCLIDILPKTISEQIIIVYTNCNDATEMTFEHLSLNAIFGFPDSHAIPFICIDNPLHYVFKEQERSRAKTKLEASEAAFQNKVIQSVLQKLLTSADAFDDFFKQLEKWGQVLTHEFSNLYKAQSEAEAQVIIIIDKLNQLDKERKELTFANEKIEMQEKEGFTLE